MRNARDTFLKYLQQALNPLGVEVYNLRRDLRDPSKSLLKENAINIEFTYDRPGVQDSGLQAAIDVIYDDELRAVDASALLWRVLGSSEMIPLMDYSSPSSPVALGTMLRWSSRRVKFTKVVSDLFYRYNCNLYLLYSDPSLLA